MLIQNLRLNPTKFKKNKIKAFSLIELSIVLIIIGLLVVGITGGASLIESARIQAVTNEFRNWKTMFHSFTADAGRLPGDLDNTGKTGIVCDKCADPRGIQTGDSWKATASSTNFGGEFNGVTVGAVAGPFVDLYVSRISDFKPKGDLSLASFSLGSLASMAYIGETTPRFKSYQTIGVDSVVTFLGNGTFYGGHGYTSDANGIFIRARTVTEIGKTPYNVKFYQRVDQKLDDGEYDNGDFRAHCSSNTGDGVGKTYDEAIAGKFGCHTIIYKVLQ